MKANTLVWACTWTIVAMQTFIAGLLYLTWVPEISRLLVISLFIASAGLVRLPYEGPRSFLKENFLFVCAIFFSILASSCPLPRLLPLLLVAMLLVVAAALEVAGHLVTNKTHLRVHLAVLVVPQVVIALMAVIAVW